MGAKSHDELTCWQLSVEFRDRVNALLATELFKRRFKYCEQLADAAESVPSNVAEGFYRFSHAEFARYLRISLGSLGEAQTRLGSARAQDLISAEEYASMRQLAIRTRTAIARLIRYLRSTETPDWPGT
jgi:four helix bundle protein